MGLLGRHGGVVDAWSLCGRYAKYLSTRARNSVASIHPAAITTPNGKNTLSSQRTNVGRNTCHYARMDARPVVIGAPHLPSSRVNDLPYKFCILRLNRPSAHRWGNLPRPITQTASYMGSRASMLRRDSAILKVIIVLGRNQHQNHHCRSTPR